MNQIMYQYFHDFHDFLLSIMEAEDDYVEVPILRQKMANSAASTQCFNNFIDRFCL